MGAGMVLRQYNKTLFAAYYAKPSRLSPHGMEPAQPQASQKSQELEKPEEPHEHETQVKLTLPPPLLIPPRPSLP